MIRQYCRQVLEEEEYKFVAVWSRALKSGLPHRSFFHPFPIFFLLSPFPIFALFYIPKVGCILRGKSGIRHQVWQFSAQNCSWFSDLVHQIAREKQYPGKKIQNISFSHFRDELSVARCLCWFSIVKPLCFSSHQFQPEPISTLDNWFSTRSKNFLNGCIGINSMERLLCRITRQMLKRFNRLRSMSMKLWVMDHKVALY